MIKTMFIAGIGGFAGTCLRYLVGMLSKTYISSGFPWSTFIVNVIGCLIIGVIYGLSEKGGLVTSTQVALFATGFCGGFTTFSSFANEALMVGTRGDMFISVVYVAVSVVAGIFSVWAGRTLVYMASAN